MFGDDQMWRQRSSPSRRIAVGSSVVTHVLFVAVGIWLSTLPRSFVCFGRMDTDHAALRSGLDRLAGTWRWC